ncbi:RNI-like protein [Gigaspora margarita]|uniref:RNI-like protein n=1 Tax=Gigaspora margarita TaxID=4874 RepID=A0A8H4ANR4_GIGMA|nr:RNI-like protein [Gigaspora margarita]
MLRKVSESLGISSLGLPRTRSLNEVFTSPRKSQPSSPIAPNYGVAYTLDRYLTNEGHKLVASYFRLNQTQKYIQKGALHQITERELDELIKSYDGVTTLAFETLNYHHLCLTLAECKLTAKLLKYDVVTNIRTLNLSRNRLSGSSIKVILEVLQKNTTVTFLDLSSNALSETESKWIGHLLKKNKSIKELSLAFNRIGSDGARRISKALKINITLKRLSLESNRLNAQGGLYISDMLKVNRTLKYIHLGSNNLQFAGIQGIAEALRVNESLISLSLDANNIAISGSKLLADALTINKTLTHLYMPRNSIGDEGLKHLCQALLLNTSIIYLDVEFNNIGVHGNTEGSSVLGKLLENHVAPRAINLSHNPIGNSGCEALFVGFHKNKTLESMVLSSCGIGIDGINAIAKALKLNQGLQSLSLYKNSEIGADGHLALAKALEQNTNLKKIQLDYNFDDWGAVGHLIQRYLTRNLFLQQEKYNVACQILKAARIMLNTPVYHTTAANKFNFFANYRRSRSIRSNISSKSTKSIVVPSPFIVSFMYLPFEIQERILISIDTNQVLTEHQEIIILNWSMRNDTLGKSKVEFLTKIFGAYHPLINDVRLWPTEFNEKDALVCDRF